MTAPKKITNAPAAFPAAGTNFEIAPGLRVVALSHRGPLTPAEREKVARDIGQRALSQNEIDAKLANEIRTITRNEVEAQGAKPGEANALREKCSRALSMNARSIEGAVRDIVREELERIVKGSANPSALSAARPKPPVRVQPKPPAATLPTPAELERVTKALDDVGKRAAALASKPAAYNDPATRALDERYRTLWGVTDPAKRRELVARHVASQAKKR